MTLKGHYALRHGAKLHRAVSLRQHGSCISNDGILILLYHYTL